MKKLLLVLHLVATTLFFSCGSDDNTDTDLNPIVPTTTGAITHAGVNFNQSGLKAETATIVPSETLTKSTTRDVALRLAFNDNVEVIVIAENFPTDQKITIDNAYYTFLKYGTKVRFNLIDGINIKATETFSVPMGSLTSSFEKDINTLTLNFKNKYEYKGDIQLPETPTIEVPEITEPTDLKTLLQSGIWKSSDKDFFEGMGFPKYTTMYLNFKPQGLYNILNYRNQENRLIAQIRYSIGVEYFTGEEFYGFELIHNNLAHHYVIHSASLSKIELTHEYVCDSSGDTIIIYNKKITLTKK